MRFQDPQGGYDRELQDEPTGQRLHRRDTPHHLKNKRIHQQVILKCTILVSVAQLNLCEIAYIFNCNFSFKQAQEKDKEKVALIIAQALKKQEVGNNIDEESSGNTTEVGALQLDQDEPDALSEDRRPNSGAAMAHNGKYK